VSLCLLSFFCRISIFTSNAFIFLHSLVPFWNLYYYSTMFHDGYTPSQPYLVNHWQIRVTLGFLIPPAWVTVWSPSKSTHYTAALGDLWMVCLEQHLTAVWLWCHFLKYNHKIHVCGSDHGFLSLFLMSLNLWTFVKAGLVLAQNSQVWCFICKLKIAPPHTHF